MKKEGDNTLSRREFLEKSVRALIGVGLTGYLVSSDQDKATAASEVNRESIQWQVAGKDYTVSLDSNGVPVYEYLNDEGWQKVERVNMQDAFGNKIPGWVVEKSDIWNGDINERSIASEATYWDYGLSMITIGNPVLKQWQLEEYIKQDGLKMDRLVMTWKFKNDEDKIINLKVGMPELNSETVVERVSGPIEHLPPRQFIDSLRVGSADQFVNIFIGNDGSKIVLPYQITPEKLALLSFQNTKSSGLCRHTLEACGLAVGRVGETKYPTSWLYDMYNGLHGNNVDLTSEAWCQFNTWGKK